MSKPLHLQRWALYKDTPAQASPVLVKVYYKRPKLSTLPKGHVLYHEERRDTQGEVFWINDPQTAITVSESQDVTPVVVSTEYTLTLKDRPGIYYVKVYQDSPGHNRHRLFKEGINGPIYVGVYGGHICRSTAVKFLKDYFINNPSAK